MDEEKASREGLMEEAAKLRRRIAELESSGTGGSEPKGTSCEEGEKFMVIFRNSLDALIMIDAENGRILEANQSAHRLFGYEPKDILGQHFSILFPPQGGSGGDEIPEDLMAYGTVFTQAFVRRDGSTRLMDLTAAVLPWGNKTAILATFRDVDEREQIKKALKKRTRDLEERIKELNCLVGISRILEEREASLEDMLAGIVSIIPSAWQYPDIACARIIVENEEFRSPNFRETLWKQENGIHTNGKASGKVEVFYLEERPEIDDGPFLKEEADLLRLIAARVAYAIDRRRWEESLKAAHDQLKEANRRLEQAYAQMRDWKDRLSTEMSGEEIGLLIDQDGVIRGVTEKALDATGRTRAEMLGVQILDLVDTASREALKKEMREARIGVLVQTSVTLAMKESEPKRFDARIMEINMRGGRRLLVLMRG